MPYRANQPRTIKVARQAKDFTSSGQASSPARASDHPLLHFHSMIGNRAMGRFIQARLKVNEPGDKYEHEADRVAEMVMHMPESLVVRSGDVVTGRQGEGEAALVQRHCEVCAAPVGHRFHRVSGQVLHPQYADEKEMMQRKPLAIPITPIIQRQAAEEPEEGRSSSCTPAPGVPNTVCSAYIKNSWWLPLAYVQNATCACQETPNVPTANCVRKFLQDRLAATPGWLITLATSQKGKDNPLLPNYPDYQIFVQTFLTPRIYQDHVDAYANCCCPSGPASYPAWIGVTTVPLPCSIVGDAIRQFGSCHGTPGSW